MLTDTLKQQLSLYLTLLVKPVVFTLDAGTGQNGEQTHAFLTEVAALSDKLTVQTGQLKRQPSFTIDLADSEPSGITFAGLPLGHEFESFVLAVLHVSVKEPKIPADLRQRIEAIDEPARFETLESSSYPNCLPLVQT